MAALVAIADAYPEADDATRRRLVELVRTAAASLDRLLTDVSTATLRLSRVDLGGIARDASEAAALGGHTVVVETEENGDAVVVGDTERLRQALDNLIGNAIGHCASGDPVAVTTRRSGTSVVVEVADQGEGISPGDLERIFEEGVRATSARPGSGLGLAVVREVAREHGGEVEVESSPGQGATFRLVLPAAFDAS
ncbi:MAG: HAMP domain-containing histidine kinase [Thermoleophilia bacterium]|nr:HAMP domain-containing histidine kinase [Thermoleophilia bacterium]